MGNEDAKGAEDCNAETLCHISGGTNTALAKVKAKYRRKEFRAPYCFQPDAPTYCHTLVYDLRL